MEAVSFKLLVIENESLKQKLRLLDWHNINFVAQRSVLSLTHSTLVPLFSKKKCDKGLSEFPSPKVRETL